MNMKMSSGWLAVLVALVPAGLMAHHSLGNYDTTKAVRIKGTIVELRPLNPHSFIFLEEKIAEGQIRRWAIEGPATRQLSLRGSLADALKPGVVIEVCGYLPKEPITWQIAGPDPNAVSIAGRLINGELLVMPDGKQESFGDYGVHKCFAAGFTDQHTPK
jgi:hypothetical protein